MRILKDCELSIPFSCRVNNKPVKEIKHKPSGINRTTEKVLKLEKSFLLKNIYNLSVENKIFQDNQ